MQCASFLTHVLAVGQDSSRSNKTHQGRNMSLSSGTDSWCASCVAFLFILEATFCCRGVCLVSFDPITDIIHFPAVFDISVLRRMNKRTKKMPFHTRLSNWLDRESALDGCLSVLTMLCAIFLAICSRSYSSKTTVEMAIAFHRLKHPSLTCEPVLIKTGLLRLPIRFVPGYSFT